MGSLADSAVKMSELHADWWSKRAVLVTGASGFLGRAVVEKLKALGCGEVVAQSPRQRDLTTWHGVLMTIAEAGAIAQNLGDRSGPPAPDMIIHLAAACGGIGANQDHPGEFFFQNAVMGLQLIECARLMGVKKFVSVGSVCAYPAITSVPFKERDLWNGYPEETNAPYGIAKRMLLVQSQAYRKQYGFNGIYLLPANLYGPGDNFDLRTSHVIPALIRKFVEARLSSAPSVTCWGTGIASRDFLFLDDAVEGILLAAEHYDAGEPLNLGTGQATTILALAARIAEMTGFEGEVLWDDAEPDGQLHRRLDTSAARKAVGFKARTMLPEGLSKTIDWYLKWGLK